MKTIIVCVGIACGLIGGVVSVAGEHEEQPKMIEDKPEEVPVEYIDFQEPLYIQARV